MLELSFRGLRETFNLSMTAQPSNDSIVSFAQHLGWAILIVATLYICYFSHLGVIGFVGPDEPRYAWIARDMAESGDWVTPRLYGKPWFEKPPLLYWGGAIFFKLFPSQPEVAARLTSAICALLATLALAWLAWRTYGEECARWLLLLLPTSVSMIGFSHAAATDMPFAGMLTLAMVCAAVVLGLVHPQNDDDAPILPRTPWLALLLFGFFLGLAVLAKGPAAIILTAGAVFFWAIFTKRWRDAFGLLQPAAIAAFCITALPWYILCARRNTDFFRIFIIEHNFKRYLTSEFQHMQPWWYYLPIVALGFVPWLLFLYPPFEGLFRIRQMPAEKFPTLIFLATWALFPLLFFTISNSKLPGYILPVFPPIGLLIAACFKTPRSSNLRWVVMLSAMVSLILVERLTHAVRQLEPTCGDFGFPLRVATWCLILGAVGSIVLAALRQTPSAFLVLQISFLSCIVIGLSGPGGKSVDRLVSTRFAAQRYEQLRAAIPSQNVEKVAASTYHLRRAQAYSLNFYLHRELPEWDRDVNKDALIFLSPRELDKTVWGLQCPKESPFPVVALCQWTASLNRLSGGGHSQ